MTLFSEKGRCLRGGMAGGGPSVLCSNGSSCSFTSLGHIALSVSEIKLGDCNGDVVSFGVDGRAISFSSEITAIDVCDPRAVSFSSETTAIDSCDPLRKVPMPNVEFRCDVALIPGPFKL